MGRCKHGLSGRYFFTTPAQTIDGQRVMVTERCECGAYVSLGEANDADPNVLTEQRAAYLANPDTCESEFDSYEWLGWMGDEQFIMDGERHFIWEEAFDHIRPHWDAGRLAAEIAGAVDGIMPRLATHDAAREGDER